MFTGNRPYALGSWLGVAAEEVAVRVGTLVARNTSVFTRFDNYIAKTGNRSEVSSCIARFSNDIRP